MSCKIVQCTPLYLSSRMNHPSNSTILPSLAVKCPFVQFRFVLTTVLNHIFLIILWFLENYRSRTEQLIHGLGGEFINIEKEDGLEEIIAQLKIKFIKMRTQLAEFENSDFHRMETDRVVRARIDLKGVEDQVRTHLYC